jgi:hypothetical protein
MEAHKCPLDALAQYAIFTLPTSAFLLPTSLTVALPTGMEVGIEQSQKPL